MTPKTREEEIEAAGEAHEESDYSGENCYEALSFKLGAKWADSTNPDSKLLDELLNELSSVENIISDKLLYKIKNERNKI